MKENLLNLHIFRLETPKSLKLLAYPRFWAYSPSLKIRIETSRYILKTAESLSELSQVFKLRQDIFLGHHEESKNHKELDIDELDHRCDHIIIVDKRSSDVCGTYRIICSDKITSFYSENEFHMDDFLKLPGNKVELGRACIERAHRNGVVIDLLWKGIATYCKEFKADYLFGCSSIHTNSLSELKLLNSYLKNTGHLRDDFSIRSKGDFHVKKSDILITEVENDEESHKAKSLLPPLLNSYFKAGANVYGEFAYDQEFQCFDYLTILRLSNVSDSFKKRYFTYLSLA